MKKIIGSALGACVLAGCASTPPTLIGADTYYASRQNAAGMFGDVNAVAGHLMSDGNQFCASMSKQFQILTENITPPKPGVTGGSAAITFKCVDHAGPVQMRPDNGVTTVNQ